MIVHINGQKKVNKNIFMAEVVGSSLELPFFETPPPLDQANLLTDTVLHYTHHIKMACLVK